MEIKLKTKAFNFERLLFEISAINVYFSENASFMNC